MNRLLIACALLVATSAAPAQDTPAKTADAVIRKYDTNHDGYVGYDELKDPELLKKYDKNGDRRITAADFLAAEKLGGGKNEMMMTLALEYEGFQSITKFDTNKDGSFDAAELRFLLFTICSRDRDQVITEREARVSPVPPAAGALLTEGWLFREFKALDGDGDELITMKEFRVPEAWMKALDKNRDGRISFDEFAHAQVDAMGGYIAKYGELFVALGQRQKVDRANWTGDVAMFNRMDENNDQVVTLQEFDRYARSLRTVLGLASDFVTRFDIDGDGKVARIEFPGNDTMFSRMDRNGDGFIAANDR